MTIPNRPAGRFARPVTPEQAITLMEDETKKTSFYPRIIREFEEDPEDREIWD